MLINDSVDQSDLKQSLDRLILTSWWPINGNSIKFRDNIIACINGQCLSSIGILVGIICFLSITNHCVCVCVVVFYFFYFWGGGGGSISRGTPTFFRSDDS